MICAGIVTYNPNILELINNIKLLSNKIDICVIVDNASKNISNLEKEIMQFKNVKLIKNIENYGIAKALNQIMIYSENEDIKWIYTFDQDSLVTGKYFDILYEGIKLPNVGIVCPTVLDLNSHKELLKQKGKICESNFDFKIVKKCITSGCLINIEAWREVGGYDEYLFIDLVDFDFCKRIGKKGYYIYQSKKAVLNHQIGSIDYHRFLWKKLPVMNHNAIRKYYMVRNIIYLGKKNNLKYYPLISLLKIAKMMFLVIFYENDKYNKINSMMKGMVDGFKI